MHIAVYPFRGFR
uniref:Uncharacterized protein n=1 Tax=Rhizophora mucronata TaxID=61149 RepID=A0A2P2QJ68_RHIMU